MHRRVGNSVPGPGGGEQEEGGRAGRRDGARKVGLPRPDGHGESVLSIRPLMCYSSGRVEGVSCSGTPTRRRRQFVTRVESTSSCTGMRCAGCAFSLYLTSSVVSFGPDRWPAQAPLSPEDRRRRRPRRLKRHLRMGNSHHPLGNIGFSPGSASGSVLVSAGVVSVLFYLWYIW